MKKYLMLIGVICIMLTGCTKRLTDFTIISTKNVPIGSNNNQLEKVANKRVKGVDKTHMILFIPTGTPNLKDAIDRAIESYPGAVALSDGVVKSKFWWIPFIYGQNSYIVEGTPLFEKAAVAKKIADNEAKVVEDRWAPQVNNSANKNLEEFSMLFFHEVKKGESLSSIAKEYGVKLVDIIKWNQLSNQDVEPGTKLRILLK